MDITYLLCPFVAWVAAGSIKFLVNSARTKRLAFDLIGYGGMPSNHAAITTSIAWLIFLKKGVSSPELGIAAALAFVVMLDASSLRRRVGEANRRLNTLTPEEKPLRERMGHTPLELFAGTGVGFTVALLLSQIKN